ncbi:MAG: SHOCT domain-containing protein [Betaproteobacteria bacterium]|nr:SHOCT domain-containing protein [Betaproteobacteria bacterium]
MFFWLVLVLVVVVAAAKCLFWRNASSGSSGNTGSDAALSVLDERHARGEMNRDEFLEKPEDLRRR